MRIKMTMIRLLNILSSCAVLAIANIIQNTRASKLMIKISKKKMVKLTLIRRIEFV